MIFNRLFYFSFLLFTIFVSGQVRILVNSVPKDTPETTKIYMASSLNGWKADDAHSLLTKQSDGSYSIVIPEGKGILEYKFTQGNWETAEADSTGKAGGNRSISFTGKPKTIENQIISWSKPTEKKSTASPNVKILSEKFLIPQTGAERRIWIYLPPDYASSKKKFPVIYMPDGQNLFDKATSFSGEWKADETLDEFFRNGKPEAIVVGIDNGGEERLNEYSPWKNEKYGGGKGALFAEFLAKTLKPYIDRTFRTLPERRYTAMVGSSMGGLITLYTGTRYPETFGKLGIFSPAFWFAENDLHHYLNTSARQLRNTKFYFLAGKNESENMITDMAEVVEILKNKKVPEENILVKTDEDGTHSEAYWARELPAAIIWMFQN